MTLRLLDLFAGIGGFSYAAEHLVGGFSTTQFVEINPYCGTILRKHWPRTPIHNDVQTFTASVGSYDVITAGFPCQDISTAGKQAGLQGTRSGLFYEVMRLAREIQPRAVILENVANLLSHANGETFQEVLYEIASAGFDAEWACIPAADLGACHKRDRVWIVAYASGADWRRRPEEVGRRQRGPADADGCRIPEGAWSAEQPANPSHMLGNGCPGQQHGQSRGQTLSEPRDGDWADVAYAYHQRLERRQPVQCQQGSCEWVTWQTDTSSLLSNDWRSFVSEPVLRRGDDGLSGRVDRLKALGNAVVPQVAAVPLRRVKHILCYE